jgi:DNA polymerase III epsilon subunit-like protein
MASPKDKPRGYFEKILAIDCETTGLCFSNDSPVYNPKTGERHQTVSWGVIVARADNLKPVDELYVEIKWNEESKKQRKKDPEFAKKAEEIHGLSREYLDKNGVTEEEAIVQIGSLIMKHWGPTNRVVTLGHNVHTFDMPFLRDLFGRYEVELKFGNRHIDTNSIGFVNWRTYNSDDLFNLVGFDDREQHNSLQDIQQTLEAARISRIIFQKAIS